MLAMPRGKKRQYTEADKAAALVMVKTCGGNISEAARKLGFPRPTVQAWVYGDGTNSAVVEKEATLKGDLAAKCEELAWMIAHGINPEKVEMATLPQMTTAFGTLVDKMRLLREQPTTIEEAKQPVIVLPSNGRDA